MIVGCDSCGARFEDTYRSTLCPHNAFPANDGNNVFTVHEESYLERSSRYDEAYFLHGKQSGKSLYEDYRWLPDLTLPMVKAIISHLGIKETDTVLDFGCARGYTVKAFRQLGYNAWGHDISEWALENADEEVKEYLIVNESALFANDFDWVIAKDVLEHINSTSYAVDTLRCIARKGIFVVVPLAESENGLVRGYDVPEYEKDVTHIHRQPLRWWVGQFHQPQWSVEGRYRVEGVKDNYSQYPTGNGFIIARRIG